jgi:pilus assembly protein Flp/PilA
MKSVRRLVRDQKGATAIEYALIASLIAIAAMTAMIGLGNTVQNTFNGVDNELAEAR